MKNDIFCMFLKFYVRIIKHQYFFICFTNLTILSFCQIIDAFLNPVMGECEIPSLLWKPPDVTRLKVSESKVMDLHDCVKRSELF